MKKTIRKINLSGNKIVAIMLSVMLAMALYFSATFVFTASAGSSREDEVRDLFTTADLMDISITELTEVLDSGRATSEEVVKMYINRINTYDRGYNSIIAINPNAITLAQELDEERANGEVRGTLHGVPIIVKDNYDYFSMATTAGAGALANSYANDDAFTIARLLEAGAIILAKANMSEFAFSGSNSRSYLGGNTYNAFDTNKTAAGSSGGSGAAMALDFGVAALGTDTGSSIRRPSSFSNLYGLRPSKGLTSIDGVVPLNADRDVTGPMCRTVSDLAIMMDVIAGTDSADHYTVDADADSLIPEGGYASYLNEDGLEGKRIGYLTNSFGIFTTTAKDSDIASETYGQYVTTERAEEDKVYLDEKIQPMVDDAIDTLIKGGAELVDMSEIMTEEKIFTYSAVSSLDQTNGKAFEWDMYTYFKALGSYATMTSVESIIADGRYVTNLSSYTTAEADLKDPRYNSDGSYTDSYEAMWVDGYLVFRDWVTTCLKNNNIDAIVYISQTDVACDEVDSPDSSLINSNTTAYLNKFGPIAGLPDLMIPMGFSGVDEYTPNSMPLGMSMFAGYGNDETLIEIAYGYETAVGGTSKVSDDTAPLEDKNLNDYIDEFIEEMESVVATSYTQESYDTLAVSLDALKNADTTKVAETKQLLIETAISYDCLVRPATPIVLFFVFLIVGGIGVAGAVYYFGKRKKK